MNVIKLPKTIEAKVPSAVADFPWPRAAAAASLITGACLLLSGRRKAALAATAAGAAFSLLEHPEAARELWSNVPGYLRTGQDLLVRAEEFVEDLAKKGEKFRRTVARQF